MSGEGRLLPLVDRDRLPASAPIFHRIAIVGLGVVGGSFGMAIRQAWSASLVIGVDSHAAMELAMRLHAVDVGADDLLMAAEADLVVLAGGLAENRGVLPHLGDAVGGNALVLALGGESRTMGDAAAVLPGRLCLACGLPRVAPSGEGLAAAKADLFRGCAWYLTPVTASEDMVEKLQGLARALGADPVVVPAADYDRLVAAGS